MTEMTVEALILKLAQFPANTPVWMEGCCGQEFSMGLGSFSCDGEDEYAKVGDVVLMDFSDAKYVLIRRPPC